jgi:peptidoglycan/xylan/chitin deacetylase (PgdA/CDA1 family)
MKVRLCLAVLLCATPACAQTRSVALTFDDLPAAGTTDASTIQSINQQILSALRKHKAPAIGFVNTRKLAGQGSSGVDASVLEDWLRQGLSLGNHTFSHTDLNLSSPEAFEKEILAGEQPLTSLLAKDAKRLEYFRFPFNHTGDTREKHDAIAAFLGQHGYRVAPCTIDNSDFVFNRAYMIALARKDEDALARIRSEYLAYTTLEIDYYSQLHKQVLGHEIPHVMLLHVDQLNADTIEDILKIFESRNYRFITLRTALSDPAYSIPDTLIARDGLMWGYRWARERNVKVDGSAEREPPPWIANYPSN